MILALVGLIFMLAGCSVPTPPHVPTSAPLPEHPLYVLAKGIGPVGSRTHSEFVIVDTDTWQVTQRTRILRAGAWGIKQDPQGRIWIGYGATPDGDQRVQVFSAQGALIKTIRLDGCADPYVPAQFAAGKAFVACLQTGFYGAVQVLDLASLEVIAAQDVRIKDKGFLIAATGITDEYLLLFGGGGEGAHGILIDVETLEVLAPLSIPWNSVIEMLVSYAGRFLLVNAYPSGGENLIVLDPHTIPIVMTQALPMPGAYRADVESDMLYVYHSPTQYIDNPTPEQLANMPLRAVSRVDLKTGESKLWPLPDNWPGMDIAVVNGKIILANWSRDEATEGLYQLDPESGTLTQVLALPGAFHLLAPEK